MAAFAFPSFLRRPVYYSIPATASRLSGFSELKSRLLPHIFSRSTTVSWVLQPTSDNLDQSLQILGCISYRTTHGLRSLLRVKEYTVLNAVTTDSSTLIEAIIMDKDIQAAKMA
jgi:hypothetical protein